jgi:lysophospholipase L1-like esterase
MSNGQLRSNKRLLAIGDSITHGLRQCERPFWLQLGWIDAATGGATLRAFTNPTNAGPEPSIGGLYPDLVTPQLPASYAHIMLGSNDVGRNNEGWLYYEERVRFLMGRLHDDGVKTLYLSTAPYMLPTPVNTDEKVNPTLDLIVGLNETLADQHRHTHVGVDFRSELPPEFYADPAHPNQQGHDLMAERLYARIGRGWQGDHQ